MAESANLLTGCNETGFHCTHVNAGRDHRVPEYHDLRLGRAGDRSPDDAGDLQEARGIFPQTDPIADAARLPLLIPDTRLHAGFLIALLIGAALWATLRWTRLGFQIRAVGAAPEAARISGMISRDRVVLATFLASGAIAGLAGGVEVSGVTYALYENLSPGWGYTAIAVALLARLHPAAVVGTGLLFGALEAGAAAMQREAGIPLAWVGAVEAMVILFVLAADQIRRRYDA